MLEPEYLELEYIPERWVYELRNRGMNVKRAKRRLTVWRDEKKAVLSVEPYVGGFLLNEYWKVVVNWGPGQESWTIHPKPVHAAFHLEDFVWLCDNWDRIREATRLIWKEFILVNPVIDLDTSWPGYVPGYFDSTGYSIRRAKLKEAGAWTNRYLSLKYGHRHKKPWALTWDDPRNHTTTLRYKTLDGAMTRAVREVNRKCKLLKR